MSGENWTPGPWRIVGAGINAIGSVDTYSGAVWGRICTAEPLEETDGEGRTWTTGGSEIGNLRLWAAAPELYEALRAILELHIAHHNAPAHAAARAAMAKARGETEARE